jgi:hypothetical protein
MQSVVATWLAQCRDRESQLRTLNRALSDGHTKLLADHTAYATNYSPETFQQFKDITKHRLRDSKDEIARLKRQLVQAGNDGRARVCVCVRVYYTVL